MSGQNGPSPSGSTVITSGVLAGPGVSGSGGGPGMSGGAVISDGTDGFAGTVSSPLVKVAEKYTYDQMSQGYSGTGITLQQSDEGKYHWDFSGWKKSV